jgi:hypothetical protein
VGAMYLCVVCYEIFSCRAKLVKHEILHTILHENGLDAIKNEVFSNALSENEVNGMNWLDSIEDNLKMDELGEYDNPSPSSLGCGHCGLMFEYEIEAKNCFFRHLIAL